MLGSSTAPFVCEVEKGAIRRFAEAIGDASPLYLNEDAARARGYLSVLAPPTFPVSFRPSADPPWIAGLDRTRVLAGEQIFIYSRPIVAGDVLYCSVHFTGIEDKTGSLGRMEVVTQELRGTDPQGRHVFTHRRFSIIRERKSRLDGGKDW